MEALNRVRTFAALVATLLVLVSGAIGFGVSGQAANGGGLQAGDYGGCRYHHCFDIQ